MNVFLMSLQDWNGISSFLVVLLMIRSAFPLKIQRWRSFLLMLLMTAAYTLSNAAVQALLQSIFAPGHLNFSAYLVQLILWSWLYSCLALKGQKRQCFTVLLFSVVNMYMVVSLINMLIVRGPEEGPNLNLPSVAGLILIVIAYRLITAPISVRLKTSYWLAIDLVPLVTMITFTSYGYTREINPIIVVSETALLVLNYLGYFLFSHVAAEMERQLQLALENQNLMFQFHQMDNMEAMLKSVRKERHELRANYFMIESLVKEGRYDEVLTQLHEVIEPAFAKEEMVETGNRFVDMVLSQKAGEARQKGIPFVINVLVPEKLAISQQMLCSLLFNLIDNAIEASEKVKEPYISLVMKQEKSYLSIEVRNRIEASVLSLNPDLNTSKKNRETHGIGMSIIRHIVKKYNGDLQISERDGYFVVSVILTMNPETEPPMEL